MEDRKGRYVIAFKDIPAKRATMPELSPEERAKGFMEVEIGLEQAQALAEAMRCLGCRRCIGCGMCLAVCKSAAIDYSQTNTEIELESDTIIITMNREKVPVSVKKKFGYGSYMNVVTFPEFEQLLSDSGPYFGLVLSPYSGEISQKIAFISADPQNHNGLLTLAIKGTLAAKKKIPSLEARLFFPGDAKSDLVGALADNPSINLSSSEVITINEDAETKKLVVTSNNGASNSHEEEFDMVVLMATLEPSDYLQNLANKLGISLADHKLPETTDAPLMATTKEGVFLLREPGQP